MKLDCPIFTDADAAREHLEKQRGPFGPVCPHCKNGDQYRITKMEGDKHRAGLYNCKECRKQFSVTVGSVFERSKIPLNKWLLATFLIASSKKGISAHQLHRMLGVTYKTAWFMAHRIREAIKVDPKDDGHLGGYGKTVEADETYTGRREDDYVSPQRKGRPYLKRTKPGKRSIVALVERGGETRMFHVKHANKGTVREILVRNADRRSTLYTDESRLYPQTGKEYYRHRTVKHSAGEYARREDGTAVHTNTIENVFSVFKRGMHAFYQHCGQHCGESHLHRYLSEFEFRYNRRTALKWTDTGRHDDLLAPIGGKRLTYRRTDEAAHA